MQHSRSRSLDQSSWCGGSSTTHMSELCQFRLELLWSPSPNIFTMCVAWSCVEKSCPTNCCFCPACLPTYRSWEQHNTVFHTDDNTISLFFHPHLYAASQIKQALFMFLLVYWWHHGICSWTPSQFPIWSSPKQINIITRKLHAQSCSYSSCFSWTFWINWNHMLPDILLSGTLWNTSLLWLLCLWAS